jgi:hypothetical protein
LLLRQRKRERVVWQLVDGVEKGAKEHQAIATAQLGHELVELLLRNVFAHLLKRAQHISAVEPADTAVVQVAKHRLDFAQLVQLKSIGGRVLFRFVGRILFGEECVRTRDAASSSLCVYLFGHCSQSLAFLVELHAFRLIRLAPLPLQTLLRTQLGVMLALLLGLFLGHRLKRLLFALLLAPLVLGTLLRDGTTTLIERLALRHVHWRRHQIEHADKLVDRSKFTIGCFQCDNIANLNVKSKRDERESENDEITLFELMHGQLDSEQ